MPVLTMYKKDGLLKRHYAGQSPKKMQQHTTAGIRWWSPTQLLISRFPVCVWQSGRDAQYVRNLWLYVGGWA